MAFLAEKERRSGSRRTVEGYARMLWPFLSGFESPAAVTPAHVLAWAHGIGLSGREPSSATIGARVACLSSFYRFLIRMQAAKSNPCDALERPKGVQSVARGLGAEEVRRLLAVVPDTVTGRRDRALLLTFILTGRRRSEVIGLTAGDLSIEGETAFYSYRGKGGKVGRRELPRRRRRCDSRAGDPRPRLQGQAAGRCQRGLPTGRRGPRGARLCPDLAELGTRPMGLWGFPGRPAPIPCPDRDRGLHLHADRETRRNADGHLHP